MRCSATSIFLTSLSMVGSSLYIACGYIALDSTLTLFKNYGPVQGRGNPALDLPAEYWVNPKTQVWEPINPNNRGNLVPQVFLGIQYYLIVLAILTTFNTILFVGDSIRSKKAVKDRNYQGKRTGLSSISCTGWLAGYSVIWAIMWFAMAAFCVIPILEFRITMQRCWDLENPIWSPGTSQAICIDLVQYGLVFFKETPDDGYALICGPGGSYNPPHGDLEGFCNDYYPTFSYYVIAFAGASLAMISMIFFALRHATNFVYLKVRRYEKPIPFNHSPGKLPSHGSHYGNSMGNPNYEHNVILVDPEHAPHDVDLDHYPTVSDEAIELIERKRDYYHNSDNLPNGDSRKQNGRRYSRTSSYLPEDSVPAYESRNGRDSRQHHRNHGSDSDTYRRRDDRQKSHSGTHRRERSSDYSLDSAGDRHRRHHRHRDSRQDTSDVTRDNSSNDDDPAPSTVSYKPKPLRRNKSRGAKSDTNLYRQSGRRSKRASMRDEYESPPSDYYYQEDVERRQSRKSRSIMG